MEMSRRDSLIVKAALTCFSLIVVGCFIAILVLTSTGNKSAAWFPLLICAVMLFGLVSRLFYLYWTTIRKPDDLHSTDSATFADSDGQVFYVMPTGRSDVCYGAHELAVVQNPHNYNTLSGVPHFAGVGVSHGSEYQHATDLPPNYTSATHPLHPPPNYEQALSSQHNPQ